MKLFLEGCCLLHKKIAVKLNFVFGERLKFQLYFITYLAVWWLSGYVWHFHDMFVLVFPSSIKAC